MKHSKFLLLISFLFLSFQGFPQTWKQEGDTFQGEDGGSRLGRSVATNKDGSVVVIGEPENRGVTSSTHGRVWVLRKTSSNNWEQMGQDLKGVGSDQFGYTVAISDDGYTIAVTSINSIPENVKIPENEKIFENAIENFDTKTDSEPEEILGLEDTDNIFKEPPIESKNDENISLEKERNDHDR